MSLTRPATARSSASEPTPSDSEAAKPLERAMRPLVKKSLPSDQVDEKSDSLGLNPKRMGRDRFLELLTSDPSNVSSFKMLKVGSSHATHTPNPDSDSDSPSDSDDSSLDPGLLRSTEGAYGSSQDLNQSFTKRISSRILAWRSRNRDLSSNGGNVKFYQSISA